MFDSFGVQRREVGGACGVTLHQPVYFLSQAPGLVLDGRLCGAPGGPQTRQTVALSRQLWLV